MPEFLLPDRHNYEFPAIDPVPSGRHRPFWSVMIPTTRMQYLEQTLKSVMAQAPDPEQMQIEVIDDASPKSMREEIATIVSAVGGNRINLYRNPEPAGDPAIFNTCIQRAYGQWVHILHDDDFVLPGFYSTLQASIEKEDTVGAAFCRHYHVDEAGRQHHLSWLERETPGILPNWLDRIAVMQRLQFACVVVRRNAYEALGGFCPQAYNSADWEMWMRIAANYPVWYEPQPLTCYRKHLSSLTGVQMRSGALVANSRKCIEIASTYLPPSKSSDLSRQAREHCARYALNLSRQMFALGDTQAAIAQIREGLRCSQSLQVKEAAIALLAETEPAQLFSEISEYTARYQKDPADRRTIDDLRQARRQLANLWLNVPAEKLQEVLSGELGQAQQKLWDSGIKNEPLTLTEQTFVGELRACIAQNANKPENIRYLLAAIPYCFPHQLLEQWYLGFALPGWLFNSFLRFLLECPIQLWRSEETVAYYQYVKGLLDFLHDGIFRNPNAPTWQNIAWSFTLNAYFLTLYFNDFNLKEILAKRAEIIEFSLSQRGCDLDYTFPGRPLNRQKIRLGILADDWEPRTETYSTIPIFEYLDRTQFEIILYALELGDRPLEQYCRSCVDKLTELPKDLREQVRVIRNDNLDILVIGTNVTLKSKPSTLLALHRLARVQVTYFASPVTTGMRHVDYYISGKLTEPLQAAQEHYTETAIVLDGTGFCFSYYAIPPEKSSVQPTRSSWGASDDAVVFISGANFYKIGTELRATWAKIIAAVPNSLLVLYPFSQSWGSSYPAIPFVNSLQAVFARYDLDPSRLVFIRSLPNRADVKECLKLADVYLDSFPYAGSNSTIDPLEMGLPTVVMDGNSLRSRQSAALLRALGITEAIAESESSYIELAVRLGNNSDLRQQYQQKILQKMSENPSFLDSQTYSAQLGTCFQQLFREWQHGKTSS